LIVRRCGAVSDEKTVVRADVRDGAVLDCFETAPAVDFPARRPAAQTRFTEAMMIRKTLVGAMAFALISSSAATLALAESADASRKAATVEDGSVRPMMMERGTDLRPCKPGNHSEFFHLTGGYRCVRNP
jgi:hypothetical protein